jgi:tetratricopeptide (TPR) repeat protein
MKTKLTYVVMATLVFALGATMAWSQATAAKVQGKITNGGKPLANATVVLTNTENGKSYTMKTDKAGQFAGVGVVFGIYEEEVTDSSGEKLYKVKVQLANQGDNGLPQDLSIDVASKTTGPSAEEVEKIKQGNEKIKNENALIAQLNPALKAQDWKTAEPILTQLVASNPNRWDYQQALGNAQLNLGKYDDAVATYEKAIPLAENSMKTDTKADPAKAKTAIGQMLTNEGTADLKLKKNDQAIAAFTKAAGMDPNPGTAYFNLCATNYNSGNSEAGIVACDKAIAADPNRADAYFIKGSLMMGQSKQSKDGKLEAPEGTAEALNKYLELAPDGPHANDVKQMLGAIGAKVETNYKKKK